MMNKKVKQALLSILKQDNIQIYREFMGGEWGTPSGYDYTIEQDGETIFEWGYRYRHEHYTDIHIEVDGYTVLKLVGLEYGDQNSDVAKEGLLIINATEERYEYDHVGKEALNFLDQFTSKTK